MNSGRALVLAAILLYAFSLRTAVASFSPLLEHIRHEFDVSALTVGLIGAAPLVCYASFGLVTPMIERRVGLERLATLVMFACAVGLAWRGLANESTALLFANATLFAALGIGNILMPPLVKAYFPERIGLLTAAYVTTMAVSTMLPAAIAVPLAELTNWRVSIAFWAVFAIVAAVPWTVIAIRSRVTRAGGIVPGTLNGQALARFLRLREAWALVAIFATAGGIAYTTFAWMPTILRDTIGLSPAEGGLMLGVFAAVAIPVSALTPWLVDRFNATRQLLTLAYASGLIGLTGLLLVPGWHTWLWIAFLNLATTTFPLTMVLLGTLTRSHRTALALSGFVQSAGYLIAAGFPVAFGLLHNLTSTWTVPLLLWAVLLIIGVPAAVTISRTTTLEEAWERRTGEAW